MRLVQGSACWAVAAACSFGPSWLAAAPVAPPGFERPTQGMSAGQVRLAEIKVELAWLADPATFPCQLAVRASDGALEIGGVVQGEQLQKRVLQLAADHGKMPVRDKLTVQTGTLARQTARDDNPQLCRNATAAMSRLTAGQAGNFEVSADANGQIVVSGHAASAEEMLKASRHLSQLAGCTSVVNHLVVARTTREGQVHTLVSADGRLTAPGEPSQLLPPMPILPPVEAMAAVPRIVTASTPAGAKTVMPSQPPQNTPYTSQLQNFAPPANQYGGATAMAAATPRYSPPMAGQQPVIYQNTVVYSPPAPKPTVIAQGSSYGGSYNPVPPPTKAPTQVQPSAVRPAPTVQAKAVQQVAYQVNPAKAPTIQTAAAMVAKAAPTPKASPTVAKPAVARPIPTQVPAQVKVRIETAFRGAVRDVAVKATPDNQLQIQLRVAKSSDGPTIGKKIVNLPELAPYKVDLQVLLQ